ncbi:MAG: four helix bundle protein [Verrucomicrobia bacterium]|nr:four helix bundle protein [Verrucomicrobiota bacterium]
MQIRSPKDLNVYQKAYALAMDIFRASRQFPSDERYSLTDSDGENGETDTWLDFARDCGYLSIPDHTRLSSLCAEVGAMLGSMINNPDSFLLNRPSDR